MDSDVIEFEQSEEENVLSDSLIQQIIECEAEDTLTYEQLDSVNVRCINNSIAEKILPGQNTASTSLNEVLQLLRMGFTRINWHF